MQFRGIAGLCLMENGIAITPCITGASFTSVLVNAVEGCNYRLRSCALYIQENKIQDSFAETARQRRSK